MGRTLVTLAGDFLSGGEQFAVASTVEDALYGFHLACILLLLLLLLLAQGLEAALCTLPHAAFERASRVLQHASEGREGREDGKEDERREVV